MRPWHLALAATFFVPSFVFLALKETPNPVLAAVKILADERWGTAVPVLRWADFTVFVTAKHVVEGTSRVSIGEHVAARVELHPELDLAAVWIQVQVPAVPVSRDPPTMGDRLLAVGYPLAEDLVIYEGIYSVPGVCSADVLPGCSGGPVFNSGRLVGIISKCIRIGYGPVGSVCYFVPTEQLLSWVGDMIRR